MYEIIKKGTEYSYFSEEIISQLFSTIQKHITDLIKNSEDLQEAILGAFAVENIPLKNGEIKNVWIEYNAKILPLGIIDAGVHNCIIYDEIPDIVLDKYNEVKNIIYESEIKK